MIGRILRFTLVGVVGGITDYGSRYLLIAYGVDPSISRAMSYVLGSTVAYYLNSFFTFSGNRTGPEKAKAAASYLACFISAVCVDYAVRRTLPEYVHVLTVSWVVSQAVATTLNFTLQNWWVFRPAPGERDTADEM
ncbi:GtrA family protein [Corynebacterium sphenisci]|uniref:GtrA family protein n=1 Tax=Corynebacterium sphenisci TaxID=191493 RepID=UPI0026E0043D|nr:GtrA family protein [Corynebacterium sphenisci]MDO5730992.1 GtrA family protein [Corynebacterium sphenisci]